MNEIVTRIHHLNPVEVVLENAEYFREVLGRSPRQMGMTNDWLDRLSATELRKAFNEQEARIAAAIAEGRAPEIRLLLELPATPAAGGPTLRSGEFGAAHGGNHSLYSERLSSLIRQITADLNAPDGVINESGFSNSAEQALARQLYVESRVGTGLTNGQIPLVSTDPNLAYWEQQTHAGADRLAFVRSRTDGFFDKINTEISAPETLASAAKSWSSATKADLRPGRRFYSVTGVPHPEDVRFVIDAAFPKGTPWGDAVRMPIPPKLATGFKVGAIGGVGLDAAVTSYQSLDALRYGDYLEAQKHLTGFGARLGFGIAGAEVAMIYTPPHPWLKLGAAIIGGIGGAAFGNSLNEAYYRRLLTPPMTVDEHMAAWLDQRNTPPPEIPGMVLPPPTQKEIDAERARYSTEYDAKAAKHAQLYIEKTIADNNRLIAAKPEDLWTTAYDLRHPAPGRYLPDNGSDGMLPEMGLVPRLDETPEYQRWFEEKNAALAEAKANGFADVVAAQTFARQKNISLSDPEAVAYKKFQAEYEQQYFSLPEIEAFAPPEHPAPTRDVAWAAVKDKYIAEAAAAKKDAVQYIASQSGGAPMPAELTAGAPTPLTWTGQPGTPMPWSVHDVSASGLPGTSFFMSASASAGQDTPLNVCGLVTTGSSGAGKEHAASAPDPATDDYALRYFERSGRRLPPKEGSTDRAATPNHAPSCTPIDKHGCEADGAE